MIEPDQHNADSAADGILESLDSDDMFVDHIDGDSGRRNILIPAERLPDVDAFRRELKQRYDERIIARPACSSVSAIGLGVGGADDMRRTSRRYSKQAGVSLQDDFTAEHAITCVVKPDQAPRLMNVFHREFDCPAEAA